MFQSFRFEGQVIFENSTSIKSWSLKSVSLFYIDIRFPSFVNEGHSVDTRFCTHDLIKENDLNDHSCTQKIMIALHASICSCITYINLFCITCINSFIAYHKNDLKILTISMVCLVSKSEHRIERYHLIKSARSTCIVSRQGPPHMIKLN